VLARESGKVGAVDLDAALQVLGERLVLHEDVRRGGLLRENGGHARREEEDESEGEEAEGEEDSSSAAPAPSSKNGEPKVGIARITRNKKKFITSITGLALFDVKHKDACKLFANKFSCGASLAKGKTDEIDIQGDVKFEVAELIAKEFGIAETSIVFLDDTKAKGGAKKTAGAKGGPPKSGPKPGGPKKKPGPVKKAGPAKRR